MRTARIALAVCTLALPTAGAGAQDSDLRGIVTADLDRKVEPCNDFFEFANGAWRAAKPA